MDTTLPNGREVDVVSVLSVDASDAAAEANAEVPPFFRDLNLDQVVSAIVAPWKSYGIEPFFHAPLRTEDAVTYRQEVMHDLEDEVVIGAVRKFSEAMENMRMYRRASEKAYFKHDRERLFLTSAESYCDGVERLARRLQDAPLGSRGLTRFRDYLVGYTSSPRFSALIRDTRQIAADLAQIRYCLVLGDGSITVRPYEEQPDYTPLIEKTFEKFRRGAVSDFHGKLKAPSGMNHIQAQIVERVSWLHPEPFRALAAFFTSHAGYPDECVERFDREVQFYVSYLSYIQRFRSAGLAFSYPRVSVRSKAESVMGGFDVALADALKGQNVVTNDYRLAEPERVIVVSGPNQGGKTTFARMFGQLHYLAALGCPVPAREASLHLCDRLLTHFERQEEAATLRGKLQDDLVRVRAVLEEATPRSVVIMNEIFASTTLQDSLYLSMKVMERLVKVDALAVWVSFLTELASFGRSTISMVSTIDPRDPAIRTFKLERRPADGLAYAVAIAEKYRVTYPQLKRRIGG